MHLSLTHTHCHMHTSLKTSLTSFSFSSDRGRATRPPGRHHSTLPTAKEGYDALAVTRGTRGYLRKGQGGSDRETRGSFAIRATEFRMQAAASEQHGPHRRERRREGVSPRRPRVVHPTQLQSEACGRKNRAEKMADKRDHFSRSMMNYPSMRVSRRSSRSPSRFSLGVSSRKRHPRVESRDERTTPNARPER